MYYDYTMILLIPGLIIAMWAQIKVQSTFAKYSKVAASRGYVGAQVARGLLDNNGLQNIKVEPVRGSLTDNYDPRSKVLHLSETVYNKGSLAALAVAAHETGHAIQDSEGYAPLRLRASLAPAAQIGSYASWIFLILGLLLGFLGLIRFGIILFCVVVLFQIVTLPVEFNASRRALAALSSEGYLAETELDGASKVLKAAALTYVAAALMAFLQLLRLVVLASGRR